MIYTVGTGWAIGYFILALASIIIGICWGVYKIKECSEKPIGGATLVILGLVFVYLWIFAAVHFRVGINERALLVNTINQTIIGVREHGVQSKPLMGVSIKYWPANTQYQIPVTMTGGTQSATTKNGTSVYDDVVVYFDLSEMDIASAYKAVNGNWENFFEKNLLPGLLSVSRSVSQKFLTNDHTVLRDDWEKLFETETENYLSDPTKGFGIKIMKGRTVLSWDFVNSDDAKAYDIANRAAYQVTQKENEKAALEIDKEMSNIRNEIINKTADGTIVSLQKISDYLKSQPSDLRPYLIEYLNSMADMEYLRIVAQEKPELIIPPHGSVITSASSTVDNSSSQNKTQESK